ncbi:hypothetical protein D9M71_848750 [compost metagenome]
MGDAGAEGAAGGADGVDVNPLVIAGGFGELVDARLLDADPVTAAQLFTHVFQQFRRCRKDHRHAQALWLETDSTSPVM